jgi:hypothetical protein
MREGLRGLYLVMAACILAAPRVLAQESLEAGIAAADITPIVAKGAKPVWLAGYGAGRQATGIHDPLFARAVVLKHGEKKVALVSVDLIGLQLPAVKEIRKRLPDFFHVTVASTHSHEAPDVIGIWGKTHFNRGVDVDYVARVIDGVVEAVQKAELIAGPVTASYGEARDETLVDDSRLPKVKDDKLAVLKFTSKATGKPTGLLVAWSCHPEAMGSRNTLVTADFPAATISTLEKHYGCPVAYFATAVGGLMGPPDGRIFDDKKVELKEGDWEYARLLGEEVAKLAIKAADAAQETSLAPFAVETQPIFVPVDNRLYRLARVLGVLKRDGFVWMNDFHVRGAPARSDPKADMAMESEVGCLQLGDIHLPLIPGEIYPELVYGKIQDPVEPNVDFPDAPLETSVVSLMPGSKWILIGLANDEIGYLIPKRQWDINPPFAYGRTGGQYGEINACSADAGPIVCQALAECVKKLEAMGKK